MPHTVPSPDSRPDPVRGTAGAPLGAPIPAPQPSRGFVRRLGRTDRVLSEISRALQVLSGAAEASRPYPVGPGLAGAAGATSTAGAPRGAGVMAAGGGAAAHGVDAGSAIGAAKADRAARAAAAGPGGPAAGDGSLTPAEKRHAAGLMRVNHVGEICAQALYRGQAAACDDPATRAMLHQAAADEVDHLAWCQRRLTELNSHPSLLNPLWYAGSFVLGLAASRAGVSRNLGFMAETERQVEMHLDSHLKQLPVGDARSRAVVEQMRQDEIGHRLSAERAGAAALPLPVRGAMRALSRVMTGTAYWI